MTLAIDGTNTLQVSAEVTSATITLTTTHANDVIVLCVGNDTFDFQSASHVISGVSDTAGLTWARRASQQSGGGGSSVDVWYAIAPTPLTSDSITFTFNGLVNSCAAAVFGVSGAVVTSPWDADAALPYSTTGGSATFNTVGSDDMLLMVCGGNSNHASSTVPAGFTSIAAVNTPGEEIGGIGSFGSFVCACFQTVSAVQVNDTVAWSVAGSGGSYLIGDALTAGSNVTAYPTRQVAAVPQIAIRGIRKSIPAGYTLGRTNGGVGQVGLVRQASAGSNGSGGSGGGSGGSLPAGATTGDLAVFNGSSWGRLSPGTSGQFLQANGALKVPSWSSSLSVPITVANGGTGLTSSPANGQLLIGNGSGYTLATLTAGSGVFIVDAAGAITISTTGLDAYAASPVKDGFGNDVKDANGDVVWTIDSTTAQAGAVQGIEAGNGLIVDQHYPRPTISLAAPVSQANGGTGQTSYTDGQLLIGDSSTGGLDKATLTAGSWMNVTNGHGSITVARQAPNFFLSAYFNPTGTSSTSFTMCGTGVTFTPARTGTLLVLLACQGSNNTSGDGFSVDIRYGTGTPPANGAAATGTRIAGGQSTTGASAGQILMFNTFGAVSGLTIGTTYWFDAGQAVGSGGTAALANLQMTIVEL